MGKGPGLASPVADLPQRNANFLVDLPMHCLFCRLARLDETRQGGVAPRRKAWAACQQHGVTMGHQGDNAGRDAWIVAVATLLAVHGEFGIQPGGTHPTAAAVAVVT